MAVVFSAELPFRSPYHLHKLTYGSGRPVVSVISGLHGNELNGIHSVNLLNMMLQMKKNLSGTVHIFPLVNSFGADECQKHWPLTNEDINKAFPGDLNGGLVQRIAASIMAETANSDVVLDVHSGASHIRELPQVRSPISGKLLELARATELPLIWKREGLHLQRDGLVGACLQRGQMALRIMGGRGITLDAKLSTRMADGLSSILASMGILKAKPPSSESLEIFNSQIHTFRASSGGFFVPDIRVGDSVNVGHTLGHLQSPIGGERLESLRSEGEGVVVTVRANPMVHAHELLVRLAYRASP